MKERQVDVMKKRTILKAVGVLGAAAAAGAIAYKSYQTDQKMKNYNLKLKFKGEVIKLDAEFESDSIAVNFTGLELDFTQATLKDNHGELKLYAEFAGIDILVPAEWHVVATGTNNKSGVNNAFVGDPMEGQPVLNVVYDLNFAGLNIRKPEAESE